MVHRSLVIVLGSNAINNHNDDERMIPNGVIEEAAEKKDESCKEKLGKKSTWRQFARKKLQKKQFAIARKKTVRTQEALEKAVHKKDALKFIVKKEQAMKKNVLKKDMTNDAFRAVSVSSNIVVVNTGDHGQIQSPQEGIKAPVYRADVSQERVALQGVESSQERNGNLVAEISQERPGVLAGECP